MSRHILQAPPREPEPQICEPDTPFQQAVMIGCAIFLGVTLILLAPNLPAWP